MCTCRSAFLMATPTLKGRWNGNLIETRPTIEPLHEHGKSIWWHLLCHKLSTHAIVLSLHFPLNCLVTCNRPFRSVNNSFSLIIGHSFPMLDHVTLNNVAINSWPSGGDRSPMYHRMRPLTHAQQSPWKLKNLAFLIPSLQLFYHFIVLFTISIFTNLRECNLSQALFLSMITLPRPAESWINLTYKQRNLTLKAIEKLQNVAKRKNINSQKKSLILG